MFSSILLADIISSVEFDHTGNYLATGDKGGRVVLFERNDGVSIETPPKYIKENIKIYTEKGM